MAEGPVHDGIAEIHIGGMTCSACTSAVTSGLESLDAVSSVDVSLLTERALVKFSGADPRELVEAVENAGFDAELINVKSVSKLRKLEIAIEGMTCGSCTQAVTQAVESLDAVDQVDVSLATDSAIIKYREGNPDFPRLAQEAVESAGFDARIVSDTALHNANADHNPHQQQQHQAAEDDKVSSIDLKIFGVADEYGMGGTSDGAGGAGDGSGAPSLDTVCSALEKLDGVYRVSTNMYTGLVTVEHDRLRTGIRSFIRCVESLGCNAIVAASADNSQQLDALKRVKALQSYRRDTIKTVVLGVPTILLFKFREILPSFLSKKVCRGIWMDDILGILMVLPILLGPAVRFYVKSYRALKAHSPTMDVLVTTSVTCAFVYSVVSLFHAVFADLQEHQMYLFDACAMILMFVLFGKYLENVARGHTSKALSELISLVPETALVVAPDTDERGELLSTDLLQVGDIVILRPGERVSADGIVTAGESYISESLITGESKLVRKKPGDQVIGGTINGTGALRFRVTSCGADTKLSQIVAIIKEAQSSRAPIQRYADYAAARFVPLILLLAAATFGGWMLAAWVLGPERLPMMFHNKSVFFMCLRLGIAVIVVACPCALGLATPTAVMVGTGVGAEHGILLKGGSIFEVGARASVVLFDKTGTLTTGKMSVVKTNVASVHWPKIRAVERASEHPVGKAIASYFHPDELAGSGMISETLEFNPGSIEVHPGKGIAGSVGKDSVYIGRVEGDAYGDTTVLINGENVGSIVFHDSVRSDAPAVVEQLQRRNLIVGIVSGDNKDAVDAIANLLGIEQEYTYSLMKPEDKVEVIRRLKDAGQEVVFVGDGINDSPALVAASVGISLEGSSHVAVESADIVLTQSSPIGAVPAALDLCRATLRRIKTNLFASAVYNIMMIPFAMGLLLPFGIMLSPIMASLAMACSSVSVVVSSLWLMRWRPQPLDYNNDDEYMKPKATWWQRLLEKLKIRDSSRGRYMPA